MVERRASPGDRRARRQSSAAGDGHVDGRHAHVAVGRALSGLHGRADAAGQPADPDRRAQPRVAARRRSTRSAHDPEWKDGNYTTQPRGLRTAAQMLWLVGSNPILRQKAAPTLADADKEIDDYVDNYMKTGDANDILYALEASRDYDPRPGSREDQGAAPRGELGRRPRSTRRSCRSSRRRSCACRRGARSCCRSATRRPATARIRSRRSGSRISRTCCGPRRRRRRRRHRPAPNPDIHYQLGPDSLPRAGVPKGEVRGPVRDPEPGLSRDAAHLLGLRAGAVRPRRAGQPDDLQRRPGVHEHAGRRPGAQRARQPDRAPRDPGDARGLHQPRPAARINPSRRRRNGATARPTARPNTTRSTTSTRGWSSTS